MHRKLHTAVLTIGAFHALHQSKAACSSKACQAKPYYPVPSHDTNLRSAMCTHGHGTFSHPQNTVVHGITASAGSQASYECAGAGTSHAGRKPHLKRAMVDHHVFIPSCTPAPANTPVSRISSCFHHSYRPPARTFHCLCEKASVALVAGATNAWRTLVQCGTLWHQRSTATHCTALALLRLMSCGRPRRSTTQQVPKQQNRRTPLPVAHIPAIDMCCRGAPKAPLPSQSSMPRGCCNT